MWPCPAPLRKLMAGAKLGRPTKRVLMESIHDEFTVYKLCGNIKSHSI